jgi:hypothetical protein
MKPDWATVHCIKRLPTNTQELETIIACIKGIDPTLDYGNSTETERARHFLEDFQSLWHPFSPDVESWIQGAHAIDGMGTFGEAED